MNSRGSSRTIRRVFFGERKRKIGLGKRISLKKEEGGVPEGRGKMCRTTKESAPQGASNRGAA